MLPPVDPQSIQHATAVALSIDTTTPTIINAVAMATTTFVAASSPSLWGEDDETPGECRLMGPFAIIVQAALGFLALLSLVFKRWRERPQRPLKTWFFDVSKQVFGSVLVHIANIFMSLLTSGRFSIKVEPGTAVTRLMARALMGRDDDDDYVPNPCSFYLLNLGIDTTLGIPILIILLKITTGLVAQTPVGKPVESIQSGNYGNPPNAWWWLKQSVIYFMGLFGMKICVLIIFLVLPWISKVGDWALRWTEGNEKLQIAFVMMIFPLIMNALQYYIIDSFIKKKETQDHERLPSEDPDDRARSFGEDLGEELITGTDSESDDEDAQTQTPKHMRGGEYNPATDGDDRTISGSSSSKRHHEPSKGKIVQQNLLPKE